MSPSVFLSFITRTNPMNRPIREMVNGSKPTVCPPIGVVRNPLPNNFAKYQYMEKSGNTPADSCVYNVISARQKTNEPMNTPIYCHKEFRGYFCVDTESNTMKSAATTSTEPISNE